MTDKELRRLSRKDLLEILIMQMEENERLSLQLEEAKKELENRVIISDKAGSIAQAALDLNNVFEAAEKAAQQYLDSIKRMEEEMKKKVIAETIEENIKNSYEEVDLNETE